MSDFWAKKLSAIAAPAPVPASRPFQPWWVSDVAPSAPGQPADALRLQMPDQTPVFTQNDGRVVNEAMIRGLIKAPADELTQEQMELIAEWELTTRSKYNQACPNCDSSNFVPAGTRVGSARMSTDKCFECGGSSSMFTGSPEPAPVGRRSSNAPSRDIRQIDTGGGAGSMYLAFRGLPAGYAPRS